MTDQQQPEIKISEEYKKLVPPLTDDERDSLYESIRKNGQYNPIIINQDGIILDGHHRYEICKELEYIPRYEIRKFANKRQEKRYVIETNLRRRQLNDYQKIELAAELENIEAEEARDRQLTGTLLPKGSKGEAVEKVADKIGVSTRTYYRGRVVREQAPEEVKQRLRRGQTTITKEYNDIKREHRRAEKKKEIKKKAEDLELPQKVSLYNMKIEDVTNKQVQDNSVDLIFTDPPYKDEYLYLYDELAAFASKKLAPGGSLVFFFGRQFMPTILEYFKKYNDLRYWWLFATKYENATEKVFPQKIAVGWKPLLWFVKGKERSADKIIVDFIERKRANQDLHDWAQSEDEANYIIENLTVSEDSIVCDPFTGSGVFGVVANRLKRYFIGIDNDPEAYNTSKNNIISKDSDK